MESEEGANIYNEKVFQIFSSFMGRITKFEDIVDAGNKYLIGFQQGLVVKNIVTANKTTRLSSYIEAGCFNPPDIKQNMNKLSTCHLGLLDNLNRTRSVVKELQCLLDDATALVQAYNNNLPIFQDKDTDFDETSFTTTCNRKPGITDYVVLIAFVYGMVKQDYKMQEKIITSLSLKSSSGELESYCLMCSLRPFIDDDIMQEAWGLIP